MSLRVLTTGVPSVPTPFICANGASSCCPAGLAPNGVGLFQVNVQIPASAPAGDAVPVVMSMGAAMSNTVTIAVW